MGVMPMPLKSPHFFVKVFRKPLVILTLMIAVILLGSYMAQYYVWNVNYSINPLTETLVVLDLGELTGAMPIPDVIGSLHDPKTHIWVTEGKSLHIYVLVPHDNLDELEEQFYSLTLWVYIRTPVDGGVTYDSGPLTLVSEGSHGEVSIEENSGLEGIWYRFPPVAYPPITETWIVWFDVVDIWVGAVPETAEGAILIYVYAIEV